MAANSSFTDVITTTLQGYSGELADNISNHNALWKQINKKGNKQAATGRTIVQELEYAQNSTVGWYVGAETFDISPSETFSAAEYNWKQLVGSVVINGLEEIQNSGKEAVHNLIRARMRNLEKTLKNTISTALYSDGTGSGSKEIGGLQLIVAETPTNSVGGIAGSDTLADGSTWWKNYVFDFSSATGVGASATSTNIQRGMNMTWINTIRGADKPDIITADDDFYLMYLESLTPNQRFMDDKGAGVGFTNLVYQGNVPVIYDDQCPNHKMFFLNTDYLFLRYKAGREFVPLGDRSSVNQDAMVTPVVWAGNMTCSNRSLQGVMFE
jgi:hypothetical protein